MPEHVTPSPFASADLDGRLLGGRYVIGSVIASGGMAQVRRATDQVLGREVAVKILHPHLASDEVLVDRFRREAVAAARLTHPSIVAIYDTVADDGINAIVMELVHGITLRDFLDQRGALDHQDAIDVAAGVAQALAIAHAAGIVHRDVKPANILLCDDRRVKVADFGIAKAGGADLTNTGTMIGTAKYLAPEQVEGGPVDPRTDIYSLGIVLYECLTGKVPFEGDSDAAMALARLHREPLRPRQVRPSVPKALDAVTMSALARDPDQRPPTAEAFRTEILGVESDDDTSAAGADHTIVAPLAAAAAEPDSFARSERRWLVPAALVAVVGLALALAGVLIGRTETGKQFFDRAREVVASSAGTSDSVEPISLSQALAFDPIGADGENDAEAGRAIDPDPDTAWRTEFYDVSTWADKDGVGLVVVLDSEATIHQVEIASPTSSWAAEIYVSSETDRPTGLDGWGAPVGSRDAVPQGEEVIEVEPTAGRAVLIWITDLGDGPPDALQMEIADVTVRGT
ncbi:MAG: protein kinase domain-containing protein [Acidimicrobiales bacterium]